MAGRKKTYQVQLTTQEREQLEQVASSRKSPQSEARRACMLLACAAQPAVSDEAVAQAVGCAAVTVRKWRRRWCETHSLQEAARSGRPRVFSPRGARTGDGVGV